MRTIRDVFLIKSSLPVESSMADISAPDSFGGGDPRAKKSTPQIIRVKKLELELTYMNNPTIFNAINKIVQTIMSGKHLLVAKDPKVEAYFTKFLKSLGNSGSDITWEELLSKIYQYQCIYGGSWIENIFNKKGNRIVDWDIIDPKKMDYAKDGNGNIILDKSGNPIGYVESLPFGTVIENDIEPPKDVSEKLTMPPNSIFMKREMIAYIKLFSVGDSFYPLGLIEPIYKTSLRKLNIEEALANSIWRHGFPTIVAEVGDANHEPTPQQIQSILDKLKTSSNKQELSVPYYYKVNYLKSEGIADIKENLNYFRAQEIAGLGIPAPFATGGGEATNRATLGNQQDMYQLTLRDIVDKTIESIRKYMFKPICDLEGFDEVPNLVWELLGTQELDERGKRLANYARYGLVDADDNMKKYIRKIEKIPDPPEPEQQPLPEQPPQQPIQPTE